MTMQSRETREAKYLEDVIHDLAGKRNKTSDE
jgi:hypothetical protein